MGYSAAEDDSNRIWIAGETSSYGAGDEDGLLIKLGLDGDLCLQGSMIVSPTPVNWDPAEEDWPPELLLPVLEVEEWEWTVNPVAASVQQEMVCRSECIPTLTEWGLIILTLLLIMSAVVVYRRRRSPAF